MTIKVKYLEIYLLVAFLCALKKKGIEYCRECEENAICGKWKEA